MASGKYTLRGGQFRLAPDYNGDVLVSLLRSILAMNV